MNFLFFSPIAWDNIGNRPIRFARELTRRGHRVQYIQLEKSQVHPPIENLQVYDLEEFGLSERQVLAAYYGFDYGAMDNARAHLAQTLDVWEMGDDKVAIFSAPFRPFLEFLPMLRVRGYKIVFDVLDDYAAMRTLGYYCYDDAAEKFLARYCDLALPLSPTLEEKMCAYGAPRVCLIKDGVELEIFRADNTPPISIGRGEITLGFWGWIWPYNVDVSLLAQLARTRLNWQIHLLGPYEESVAHALDFPNIHFHGQVAREQLSAYAAQFDVCLLPAPNDAFNRARDPLKVYEYLACGKSVVATDQPQLVGMPNVYLSRNADEFVTNVERAAHIQVDFAQLNEFLAQQTWEKRTDELLHALAETPHEMRMRPDPPHGAISGAEKEIERWQAYAQHLGKLVDDRNVHVRDLENALAQSGIRARWKRLLRR